MRIWKRPAVEAPFFQAPSFPAPSFPLGQEGKIPPGPDGVDIAQKKVISFALANLGLLAYGAITDFFVRERTDISNKIVTLGTIGTSLVATVFSLRLVTTDPAIPINPIWRLVGGFFTYTNAIVLLRAAIDLFREKPKYPSLPKYAREILHF